MDELECPSPTYNHRHVPDALGHCVACDGGGWSGQRAKSDPGYLARLADAEHALLVKLPDPDHIGQSEYRVLHDLISDIITSGHADHQAVLAGSLDEVERWIIEIRRLLGIKTPVRRFLDLSTAHLPERQMQELGSFDGVIAYEHGEYGWLMWVPDDIDDHIVSYTTNELPREIVAVWRHARDHGCDYVLFDRDAERIDALPAWEW